MMVTRHTLDIRDINIREGTLNDLAELLPVMSAMSGADMSACRRSVQAHLEDLNKTAYVCMYKGKMVGLVTVEICEEDGETYGYINDIWVEPECRGSGIGSRFACEAALFSEKSGATKMYVHVSKEDFRTQSFFKKMGYEPERKESTGYILYSEKIPRYFV